MKRDPTVNGCWVLKWCFDTGLDSDDFFSWCSINLLCIDIHMVSYVCIKHICICYLFMHIQNMLTSNICDSCDLFFYLFVYMYCTSISQLSLDVLDGACLTCRQYVFLLWPQVFLTLERRWQAGSPQTNLHVLATGIVFKFDSLPIRSIYLPTFATKFNQV